MAVPIFNPPIPYLGPIPDGMPPGKIIYIQGFIPPMSQSFAVNLQCGPNVNPRDDIALHINPRFAVKTIARNSLQGQIWGVEDSSGHFPLQPGQQFELIILSEMDSFKIAFNGQHFASFPFRIPVQRICYLSIDGDVNIACIRFEVNMPQAATAYAPGQVPSPAMSQPPGYSSGMLPMPPSIPYAGYGSCPPAPQTMSYGSSYYGVSTTHSPMHTSSAIPVPGHGHTPHGSHFHTAPISYPLGVLMGKHMSKEMKKMHKKEKKLFKHKHKHHKLKLKHHHGLHKRSSSSSSSD